MTQVFHLSGLCGLLPRDWYAIHIGRSLCRLTYFPGSLLFLALRTQCLGEVILKMEYPTVHFQFHHGLHGSAHISDYK